MRGWEMRVYSSQHLQWQGNALHLGRGRKLVEIVQDAAYPIMWRVRLPDGTLTDMANMSRAKDTARTMALRILNREETGAAAGEDGLERVDPGPRAYFPVGGL